MLVTPSYTHWSRVTASSLVEVGPDEVRDSLDPQAWVAYRIHQPLHERRPDAVCVMHAHPSHIVALSMIDEPLNTAEQNALIFSGRIAYTDDFDRLSGDGLSQGAYMTEALGADAVALILRNHGVVTVGATVAEAYTYLYLLDRACKAQILAMSTGRQLRSVAYDHPEEIRQDRAAFQTTASRHFEAMRAVLDEAGSDYAA
jgi:ribulose-5-phosphate 4-epimerase/fuculose-1-phosphate aldolase